MAIRSVTDRSRADKGIGAPRVEAPAVVRAFYDRHPYPPPVTDLDAVRDAWSEPGRRLADHLLYWPNRPYDEKLNILVAGCGTAQAAKYAIRHPAAHVVGIDVSSTSLHHTQKLKKRYKLTNLTVHCLPIEKVQELEESFDKIICTGVLHHLPDPDSGLRSLRAVLQADGAMQIMVYAPYGRAGVYMIQEYARRLGIGATDDEIADLVAVLVQLPAGHPLEHLLREAPDFRRKAALADALLNPLDRAFSVPELYAYLQRNGIAFGRWVRQAPYLPQCGSLETTPHAARLRRLPPPEQHAALELFRGTMVRHSLIAYRDDYIGGEQPDLTGDNWRQYVPIRRPHTLCVEERVPPGAAGVLINRSHSYPDLYLPISRWEKRIYRSIDGEQTIRELLAEDRHSENRERIRDFFIRLWQYDQVVFNISRVSPK